MHFEKSPKEKLCYPLPTVKKLLEQKRKRESPSSSTATTRPAPLTTVPVCSPGPSTSTGVSGSYSDMAVSCEQWTPIQDATESFSYYPTTPSGAAYATAYSPPVAPNYSTEQQISTYDLTDIPQTLSPLPTYHSLSQEYFVTEAGPCLPSSSFTWSTMGASHYPQLSYGSQMDATKLEEARMFLRGMDYSRTLDQDEDGDTILHIYTAKGLREFAFAAAERLKEEGKLDTKEHKGKTALLVAVTANQPDIIHDLLFFGADINVCDVKGQTALHLAAIYGFPTVLQVILSIGLGVNLEARNFEGLTPLHCAAISHSSTMKALSAAERGDPSLQTKAEEKLSCLNKLLNAGASLVSQEIKSNKTVLHLAVKEGNIHLVRHLLRIPMPNMKDFVNMKAHGHTALHMAAGLHGNCHQEEMLQLLLARGADPSVRNLENDQPAHLLQSGPRGEQLKLLLKRRSTSTRRRGAYFKDQD